MTEPRGVNISKPEQACVGCLQFRSYPRVGAAGQRHLSTRQPNFRLVTPRVVLNAIWREILARASSRSRGQVDFVDDSPVFDEVVERGYAVQTTQAALLVTAFFGFVVNDGPIIDPDRSSLDLSRDPPGTVDVGRPDRRGQAVVGVVCECDGLVFCIESLHDQDWSKHLIL